MTSHVRLVALGALVLAACTTPHGERTITRDEPTPLGITAGEIVAKAEGTLTGTLRWVSLPDPGFAESFTLPGSGSTQVTVRTSCGHGESRLLANIAQDSIEVDCFVTATTTDGLLHDTWPCTVSVFRQRDAQNSQVDGPTAATGWVAHTDVNGTLREALGADGWIDLGYGAEGSTWGGSVRIGWGKMKDDGSGNWGGGVASTPLATFSGSVPQHK